ncbi:hypothetical protein K438DRAFT_1761172 [Mycena galopus ATCC 62051]|nr:hypothetical protein K438DRAFT_1761172 [Mycena galopus ATCC 62051]
MFVPLRPDTLRLCPHKPTGSSEKQRKTNVEARHARTDGRRTPLGNEMGAHLWNQDTRTPHVYDPRKVEARKDHPQNVYRPSFVLWTCCNVEVRFVRGIRVRRRREQTTRLIAKFWGSRQKIGKYYEDKMTRRQHWLVPIHPWPMFEPCAVYVYQKWSAREGSIETLEGAGKDEEGEEDSGKRKDAFRHSVTVTCHSRPSTAKSSTQFLQVLK